MKLKAPTYSVAQVLYWLCAVTTLFVVGRAIDRRQAEPYPGEPDRELILNSFHEAVSSVEGVPACSLKNFHRGGQAGLSQTFSLHAPLHVSMIRIEALMSNRGWKVVERAMKLCRGGLSAMFSADRTYAEKRFDIRVVWAKEPNQTGYCPR